MQALLSQACKRQPSPGEAVAESAPGAGPARFCNWALPDPAKDRPSRGRAAGIVPGADRWGGMRWGTTLAAGFGGWICDGAEGQPAAGLSRSCGAAGCIASEGRKIRFVMCLGP